MSITPKQRWLICGLYAAAILGVSIMPASALAETPEFFPQQDKVLHALMYGGWAALLAWTLQKQLQNRAAVWMVGIVLTAAAYGALMEVLQGSLVGLQRSCSGADMLANLAGAILGVGLFACAGKLRPS